MTCATVKKLIENLKKADPNSLISVSITSCNKNHLVTDATVESGMYWDGKRPKSISDKDWNGAERPTLSGDGPQIIVLHCN